MNFIYHFMHINNQSAFFIFYIPNTFENSYFKSRIEKALKILSQEKRGTPLKFVNARIDEPGSVWLKQQPILLEI